MYGKRNGCRQARIKHCSLGRAIEREKGRDAPQSLIECRQRPFSFWFYAFQLELFPSFFYMNCKCQFSLKVSLLSKFYHESLRVSALEDKGHLGFLKEYEQQNNSIQFHSIQQHITYNITVKDKD